MNDFEILNNQLLPSALSYLQSWFPAGKLEGKEFKVGSLHGESGNSLSINTQTGKWSDFASSESGGDLISLYAAINKIEQNEALKILSGKEEKEVYTKGIEYKELPLQNGHIPSQVWQYRNEAGKLLGAICRYDKDDKKTFLPLTAWRSPDGKIEWKNKSFPRPRPLYGLDKLWNNPDCKVLICEGEKSADAAQSFLPEYVCITWPGGAKAVKTTSWTQLKNRDVYIWPDNDTAGREAANEIQKLVKHAKIICLPDDLPDGWDLADAKPDFRPREYIEKSVAIVPIQDPEFVHWQGKTPRATKENLQALIGAFGIICRYNLISKEMETLIPNLTATSDNFYNVSLGWLASKITEYGMSTSHYEKYILNLCDESPYNPVKQWLDHRPWDGKNRLDEFFATIDAENNLAKDSFIYHWMIGAVAAALSPNGIDAAGIIVLQGSQGIGKTWWFKKLCPQELQRADATVNPADKDSVEQAISYWLVELGELDATFRKADIASLKGFITRDYDMLRKSYAPRKSRYPRRTVFAASVNEKNYLHDNENRRFWTIECKTINSYHDIDMQQVWAQIYDDWKQGAKYTLTEEAKASLKLINEEHQQVDPIYELIAEKYNWSDMFAADWKSATQIARELELKNVTQKETRLVTQYVMKLNGNQKKRTAVTNLLLIPMKK